MTSAFMGKLTGLLERELIPKFSDAAADVLLGLGDELPSKESIVILLEEAFKKVLGSPNKAGSKKKASEPKKVTKKKVTKKKAAAPKQKWATKEEMEALLGSGEKCFCGFVADRGPNKGKFCACEITEEAQNCGVMTDDKVWTPHTIEEEKKLVGEPYHKVRCKKCWAVGKDGAYRKEGAYDRMYNVVEEDVEDEIPDIPELPENDPDEIDPGEKLVEGAERSITIIVDAPPPKSCEKEIVKEPETPPDSPSYDPYGAETETEDSLLDGLI